MNRYKAWILTTTVLVTVIGTSLVLYNYLMDPLWIFSHSNKFNAIQDGFNERQQKINKITFGNSQYDTLIIGSSRSTYINQHELKGHLAFNLSASSMKIDEYNDFIEYAKKINKKDFEYIILGLDFMSTNVNREMAAEHPQNYFDTANHFLYRFKVLTSLDTLKLSKDVFNSSINNRPVNNKRYYDRFNVAYANELGEKNRQNSMLQYIYSFYRTEKEYRYDPQIKNMFEQIARNNPNSTFILFTTPESMPRFQIQMENEDHWNGYKQWLEDITDVFGAVYNFMDINSITENLSNYYDSQHFYPEVGTLIAHKIMGSEVDIPEDFGIIVTPSNLRHQISEIQERIHLNANRKFDFILPSTETLPEFETYFDDWKGSDIRRPQELSSAISPMDIQGIKGNFIVMKEKVEMYNVMRVNSSKLDENVGVIQFGYRTDKNGFSLDVVPEQTVIFVATVRGRTKNMPQIFIQDKIDKWETKRTTLILDDEKWRTFVVTKDIRDGTQDIGVGFRWSDVSRGDWLQIQSVKIFVE